MNSEPSARPRRYLAVWFPWLPSDRLRRLEQRDDAPPEDARPVVLAEKIKGALRLAAVAFRLSPVALRLSPSLSCCRAVACRLSPVACRLAAVAIAVVLAAVAFGRNQSLSFRSRSTGLRLGLVDVDSFRCRNGLRRPRERSEVNGNGT